MAESIYVLCALTCLVCTVLLARGYRSSRSRLLAWSTACFAGLFVNNVLVVVDLIVVPEIDLHHLRTGVAFTALAVLVVGLVWEDA